MILLVRRGPFDAVHDDDIDRAGLPAKRQPQMLAQRLQEGEARLIARVGGGSDVPAVGCGLHVLSSLGGQNCGPGRA